MHLLLLAQSADPTGLAGGRWPVPSWAILVAGGVVTVLALVFLVVRARRARKLGSTAHGPGTRP